jgi:ankyrin repeat protein
MASRLETLPNEILDSILEYLINHDIGTLSERDCLNYKPLSRLSQCSRFLHHRLEPLLYCTLDARNEAMRHGCMTGNLHVIRKAVSYGANPSVTKHVVSTYAPSLALALKCGQLEAYTLLLELGAGLTPHDYGDDLRKMGGFLKGFTQKLARPSGEAFLKAFVEARAETPYCKDDRRNTCSQAWYVVSKLRFPDVVSWASPALLEMLLDNGARLNETVVSLNPLSAACLRGDIDVFNLLVARGAHVDMDSLRTSYKTRNSHIPIFMAARYMGETGDSNMLDACIAGGADVNRPCHAPWLEDTGSHVCTTPLLIYLESIKSWDTASSSSIKQHLTPCEGVAHFIHVLGAEVPSPVAPPIRREYSNPDQALHDRTFAGIPSPVELLLAKWGIGALEIPEFFSVIKFLVEHGGTGPDLARILVRFDGQNESPGGDMDGVEDVWRQFRALVMPDVEALWQQFLSLLMPQMESLDQASKNALLRRVIVDKAGMREQVAHPSRWVKVRAIGRASISAVVRAGADINHVIGPADQWPARNTPLHQLLSSFVHTDCLTQDFLHDHSKGQPCAYTRDFVESFGDFLAFLVSEGADPLIEDNREHCGDEKTAIDTLLSPMKKGRIVNEGGTAEQGLMHLIARLQGARQAADLYG